MLTLRAFIAGMLLMSSSAYMQDVRTVERVDLDRYLGEWYEVARFPNRFQDQCAGDVVATYSRRDDGRIEVVNRCRLADGTVDEAAGVARVVDAATNAKLKVRFAPGWLSWLPRVWGDYWIIGLADDYSWATIGSPDRKYLWILSRTRDIDASRLEAAREAARANGFDLGRLVMTQQLASRVEQHTSDALGTVAFPVTCSEQAQAEFNRAVALLHHMTYPQAREAFQRITTTDPRCAMAHWGIAMTLFQPLWPTRPGPEALQQGWDAAQKAKALQPPTERERLFVAAAEAFFLEPTASDYWARIRRWEQAAERVYASFRNDPEAAAFYAVAHLAIAPGNTISRVHADRAAEILLRVYERNPDHPGAMHYLVHANDVPGRERELLEITRKYETVAPRNPHALHMPTHIYTRLGDWNAVVRGNVRAAQAALEHPAGEKGQFVWDEFPHAVEYLVYAHLQRGADAEAAAQLKRLRATERLEPTFKTAFHLASTGARYALERRAWNEAAQIAPREPGSLDWDRFTWPEAIARFARGLGAARSGNVGEARAAVERLDALEAATRKAGEELFARNIQVLRLELHAWVAHAEGKRESSVALMREAAELETSTPKHAVTPGPTLPAHELLGDLLMEQKQSADALASYTRSMALYPGRFNALLGAARAARALGDASLARTFYQQLLQVADGGTRQPAMREAQSYLKQPR